MTGGDRSRRRFLRSGLAVAAAGVAGCSNLTSLSGSNSPIIGTSIEGRHLVVELQSNNSISELKLKGPDGGIFRSTSINGNTESVKLALLDLFSGKHYTPGKNKLVGVRDGDEVTLTNINLRPELDILSTKQYSGGDDIPQNRGNLSVTVENSGTAPTWIYYLAYEGTPNATHRPRNDHPKNSPLQALEMPESRVETILEPSEKQVFRGRWPPFQLSGDEYCGGMEVEFSLTAYSAVGENANQTFRATLSGEELQQLYRVSCSDISINPIEGAVSDG